MKYKRSESFRHVLERRVDVTYKLISGEEGEEETYSEDAFCYLVDISPSGARILMSQNLPTDRQIIRLQLTFTLFAKPISVKGQVIWKQIKNGEYLYGIDLDEDDVTEALIISELKLRRRQEIKEKKLNMN